MDGSALSVVLKHLALRNPVRFGSFGEHVFMHVAESRGHEVASRHEGRMDFEIDGVPVEVKPTAQRIDATTVDLAPRAWSGARRDGVAYARVEFLADGVRVSVEGEVWGAPLTWRQVEVLYDEWSSERGPNAPAHAEASTRKLARPCVQEAKAICSAHDREARVVFRTGLSLDRPPALDAQRGAGKIHVFISFLDEHCRRDEINAVFAIPDEDMDDLPRLPARGAKQPRIDLRALGTDYRFRNLDDFRERFFAIHDLAATDS